MTQFHRHIEIHLITFPTYTSYFSSPCSSLVLFVRQPAQQDSRKCAIDAPCHPRVAPQIDVLCCPTLAMTRMKCAMYAPRHPGVAPQIDVLCCLAITQMRKMGSTETSMETVMETVMETT